MEHLSIFLSNLQIKQACHAVLSNVVYTICIEDLKGLSVVKGLKELAESVGVEMTSLSWITIKLV